MNSHVVIPVLIAFVIRPCAWTGSHSFPEKVKDGTDGACGGCTVSFEEGRNTDNGRYYHSGSCRDYVPVLCEGLSKIIPVLSLQ